MFLLFVVYTVPVGESVLILEASVPKSRDVAYT